MHLPSRNLACSSPHTTQAEETKADSLPLTFHHREPTFGSLHLYNMAQDKESSQMPGVEYA